ncbi:MAG TPA: putative Ig domain-containing protein, partial [Myxococcales bacterium]
MRCHFVCLAGLLLACSGPSPNPAQPAPDAGSGLPYSIAAAELPRGRELIPYSASVTTSGQAPAGLQWVVAEGSLPEGLRLDAASAGAVEIVGAPQHGGTFTFSLAAVAPDGRRALREFSLVIDPAMSIEGVLADGIEGEPYAATLTLVNFNGPPVQWSAVPGTLPPGLVLEGHGASATLTGTPPAGRFDFSVSAEDGDGERTGRLLHLFVRSSLSIAGSPPANGVESVLYDANLQVRGGTGAGYHWHLSGAPPPGIALRNAEGSSVELIGVLTASGPWSFAVGVTDDYGGSAELPLTISVAPRLQLVTGGFPSGLFGAEYRATASATGGSGAGYRWSVISGTLPPGLTLTADGATATIAGRPSAV